MFRNIMSKDLLPILCKETWHLDSRNECEIKFKEDGTGELICINELQAYIAAQIEWKSLSAKRPNDAALSNESKHQDSPAVVAQFILDITLTKRHITSRGPFDNYYINDERLTDEAFGTRQYHVNLEKGNFHSAFDMRMPSVPDWAPVFAYRLVFDKSPYPLPSLWKEPDDAPDPEWFPLADWREFCAWKLERDAAQKADS
ncbi:hypothetical protein F4810DRAFT_612154 [Camillea tinctor]|nr:hypothetical protein F4810DRAFT_612154 [Camillea tinctor]